MPPSVITRPVTPHDLTAIAALHARVFGPGRFARTAYRVREGKGAMSRFCRVADLNGRLIAAVHITDIAIGGTGGAELLGPLAVDPDFHGQGYGRQLVAEAMEAMTSTGVKLAILVGDEPYYGKFGFAPVTPGQLVFPGPVNPKRILAAELASGARAAYRGNVIAIGSDGGKA